MKIAHRNPTASFWRMPESDPVDPEYEAEVRACTERGEREHERLQGRLARAERRLAKLRAERQGRKTRKRLAELTAIVEIRRAELEQYRRAMVSSPASAQHRGTKSFRPVPDQSTGI